MKTLLALITLALLAAPAFAQEAETERKTEARVKVKVEVKDGEVEIEREVDEALKDLPERIRDIIDRAREGGMERWNGEDFDARMKELREKLEKMREEIRIRIKDIDKDWENHPDAEVEEWEEVSPDGSTVKKVKIVRIRKSSESTPEAPKKEEAPKREQ